MERLLLIGDSAIERLVMIVNTLWNITKINIGKCSWIYSQVYIFKDKLFY